MRGVRGGEGREREWEGEGGRREREWEGEGVRGGREGEWKREGRDPFSVSVHVCCTCVCAYAYMCVFVPNKVWCLRCRAMMCGSS